MPLLTDLAAEIAHVKDQIARAVTDSEVSRLERVLVALGADGVVAEAASAVRSVAAVPTDAEGWAELAISAARDGAKRRLDGVEEAMALAALRQLEPAAEALTRAGSRKVSEALGALWEGDEDGARNAWLSTDASFDERRKAMRDMTIFAVKAGDQAAADWDAFLASVENAGKVAFKVAIPFLLAAIGV